MLPVFVATGGHLRRDLPQLVNDAMHRHAGLEIAIQPAVGEDQRFRTLVEELACLYLGASNE